jgi:hypothetical protein
MPSVRFTATRSLSGVSLNTLVTYALPLKYAGLQRERRVFSTQRRTLTGARETYYESEEEAWTCQTYPLLATPAAALVMFLDSVERGEPFEMTLNPTSSPITWFDVVLDKAGYTEQRHGARQDALSYSFVIVKVP